MGLCPHTTYNIAQEGVRQILVMAEGFGHGTHSPVQQWPLANRASCQPRGKCLLPKPGREAVSRDVDDVISARGDVNVTILVDVALGQFNGDDIARCCNYFFVF